MNVDLGFSINDLDPSDVKTLIERLDPVFRPDRPSSWTLDCSRSRHLGPTAAVFLATTQLLAQHEKRTSTILLPDSPQALQAFCRFSGLHELVHGGPAPDTGHPKNETVPLHQFDKHTWTREKVLTDLVRRHMPDMAADSGDLLRLCYSEIAQNIEDHAKSPIGGVGCARYFKQTRELRIAVADRGIGIAKALRSAGHRVGSDEDALLQVSRGGVSSKSRPNNAGQGVSNLVLITRGNLGSLIIVSGSGLLCVRHDRTRFETMSSAFPGTAVLLALRVESGDTEPAHE